MSHTPGPWTAEFSTINNVQLRKNIVQYNKPIFGMDEEMKANIRLIQSAPDMLDALEKAENWIIDYCDPKQAGYECELRTIRSAITKAKKGF